jgi:hypothetical protein
MYETARRSLRIVLAGGSGLLGRVLAAGLQAQGHRIAVLTRSPYTAEWTTVHWDGLNEGPWVDTLEGADACIDLTGTGPWRRLSAERRGELVEARLAATELLGRTMARLANPPKVWMLGSSIDVYPQASKRAQDAPMDETTAARPTWRRAWKFAGDLARENEAAFFAFDLERTRQVALRTAPVCAAEPGSLFGRLSRMVRMGLGGALGGGRQWVSWIHELDYLRAVEFLLAGEELEGVFNLCSPNPVRNRTMMEALRWAWDVPNGLPSPWLAVELGALALGPETALLLKSRRVTPRRLLEAGFGFAFAEWPEAAEELAGRYRERE